MMRRSGIIVLVMLAVAPVFPQTTGGLDYGLGGSSVMWLPRASALFHNPAELARIREGSFSFTSHRFSSLASFSGSYFIPFVGTFAAGVASFGPAGQYSIGYGGQWSNITVGAGLNGFDNTEEAFGFSAGASYHVNTRGLRSGLHSGFSIINLSDKTSSSFFSMNLGAAYWVFDDLLRVQAALQHTPVKNFGLAGLEIIPVEGIALQVGSRSFKEISGGFSLRLAYVSLDFSAGKTGVVFSVNTALSEPAAAARDRNNDLGLEALDENRYADARRFFELAYEYDPMFMAARTAADSAAAAYRTERADAEKKGQTLFENKRYVESSRQYAKLLQMDPDNDLARSRMKEIQGLMKSYFFQLILTGDSLRSRRETERARRSYQQALDLDPGNDSIMARLASLKDLAQDNIRTMLSRAGTYLQRNQLDEAEREYEQVLANEPRNSRARQGLATVRTRRTDEIFEHGKTQLNEGRPLEALRSFLQVLDRNPRHREVGDYLDQTRQILRPEVDGFFRSGLQFYTKEDYESAIEEWNKGLLIDPNHQGIVEYRKRAEEKLEALKRLK